MRNDTRKAIWDEIKYTPISSNPLTTCMNCDKCVRKINKGLHYACGVAGRVGNITVSTAGTCIKWAARKRPL